MKPSLKLLIVFCLAIFINSCKQECTKESETLYVNESYLPTLIPYSDTSTRLFLKNGTDTLLFKSQGLVKDFGYDSRFNGNCPVEQNLQRFSLKMKANDSDYFKHTYVARGAGVPYIFYNFTINRQNDFYSDFHDLFDDLTQIKTIIVLGTSYDSSYSLPNPNFKEIYVNPRIGLLKVKTTKYTLELIK